MSILFSGDFHANEAGELSAITKRNLIQKYGKDKFKDIKYHIILGDGGFLWPGNYKTDLFNNKSLACRPFPILCVIGNHEPILGMKNLQETDIGIGEPVYKIYDEPFIAYLKRGKVYYIDGFKMLVLGGALSIDKNFRKLNISWWENEYWSWQEKEDLFNLIKAENTFDFVLSHTGPHNINERLFSHISSYNSEKYKDDVAFLNDEVAKKIEFKEWWCGHWHRNLYHYDKKDGRGYQYLYRGTKILDRPDNKITVFNELGDTKR